MQFALIRLEPGQRPHESYMVWFSIGFRHSCHSSMASQWGYCSAGVDSHVDGFTQMGRRAVCERAREVADPNFLEKGEHAWVCVLPLTNAPNANRHRIIPTICHKVSHMVLDLRRTQVTIASLSQHADDKL